MTTVTLSLVSHTNAGKTTLARTLLGRDIGEVRDAPHVTEFAEAHGLIDTADGDRLVLWDTPGFGDSARLVRRLRGAGNPIGWLLSQVWDRWRDRPFWATQQALRHVQAESDVVLYLVNAAESPAGAGYVAPEMDLLQWLGKPVVVLLNQLGAPRAAAAEAADVQAWRDHLARWPLVQGVLPLDAFARCWVHERTLLAAVQQVLQGDAAAAMERLIAAWQAQRNAAFDAAMAVLAEGLARAATAREPVADGPGAIATGLMQWGARLARRDTWSSPPADAATAASQPPARPATPASAAEQRLLQRVQDDARRGTARLLALHGLQGDAAGEILSRVQAQFTLHGRVPEGRAAVLGGAVTGALAGLKADILSGGLTLGGGLLAGGLLGALGAAGVARGINVLRDTGHSWVEFDDAALAAQVQAALLRYLAVAHFGRGRGDWVQGEAPPHWPALVSEVLAAAAAPWQAVWDSRSPRAAGAGAGGGGGGGADPAAAAAAAAAALADRIAPLLRAAALEVLQRLYPRAA